MGSPVYIKSKWMIHDYSEKISKKGQIANKNNMFFGSKKIPELAKGLGKAMREVKDASNEIKKEIRDSATSIKDDFDITK